MSFVEKSDIANGGYVGNMYTLIMIHDLLSTY